MMRSPALLTAAALLLLAGCRNNTGKPGTAPGDIPLPPPGSGTEKPRVQQRVFSDSVTGMRFALPAGYTASQGREGLSFMAPTPDDQDPAMGYTRALPIGDDGKARAFEDTADLVIARMKKVEPSAKGFTRTPMVVAGRKALLISFTMKVEDASYVWKQVMLGEGAAGGLVQFSYPSAGEDLYAPVFKAILDSLELPDEMTAKRDPV